MSDYDTVKIVGGTLRTHPKRDCAGEFCTVHNPSDHPLKDAPLSWRADKGVMERVCPHGIGHDDPDDRAYRESVGREASGIHGCDGCCR